MGPARRDPRGLGLPRPAPGDDECPQPIPSSLSAGKYTAFVYPAVPDVGRSSGIWKIFSSFCLRLRKRMGVQLHDGIHEWTRKRVGKLASVSPKKKNHPAIGHVFQLWERAAAGSEISCLPGVELLPPARLCQEFQAKTPEIGPNKVG